MLILATAIVVSSCDALKKPSDQSSAQVNDWTNEQARQKYLEVAEKTCSTFHPRYFGLAIEVNTYFQHHPEDFDRFVEMYRGIYDTLKSSSGCAETDLFVSFQLERMKGLGTSVGYNGRSQWEILDKFAGKLDLLVFTTYPEVEYSTPAAVPADYYASITDRLPAALSGRRLAFAEMGWNSQNLISVTGHNNSYLSPALFIERFAITTNEMKERGMIEFAAWAFMHDFRDTGSFNPFRTIGLRDASGGAKDTNDTAWNTWAAFKSFLGSAYPLGIGPVPRHFPGSTAEDWLDMYQKVPHVASLILAQTDWRDTPESSGEIPRLFADINVARAYHQAEPIYAINFFDLGSGDPKIALPSD